MSRDTALAGHATRAATSKCARSRPTWTASSSSPTEAALGYAEAAASSLSAGSTSLPMSIKVARGSVAST